MQSQHSSEDVFEPSNMIGRCETTATKDSQGELLRTCGVAALLGASTGLIARYSRPCVKMSEIPNCLN